MRYLGSKTLLLKSIYELTSDFQNYGCFCDPFGGIGTVGSYMKGKGFSVLSGDILKFAYYFQVSKIQNSYVPNYKELMTTLSINNVEELENYLSELQTNDGWFIDEYAIKRNFFTETNASKIQACINVIWHWRNSNIIDENEYAILISSLIDSMDKVANTAGTYYAYLKSWYRKALKPFVFKMITPIEGKQECHSYFKDAVSMIKTVSADILYLDPPYNERSYGSYYHLPETIARGKVPKPKGKSGVFTYQNTRSGFNNKSGSISELEQIINFSNAKCVIFHYTDKGLIPYEKIMNIFSSIGKVEEYYFDCKGYCTKSTLERSQHHIYKVIR